MSSLREEVPGQRADESKDGDEMFVEGRTTDGSPQARESLASQHLDAEDKISELPMPRTISAMDARRRLQHHPSLEQLESHESFSRRHLLRAISRDGRHIRSSLNLDSHGAHAYGRRRPDKRHSYVHPGHRPSASFLEHHLRRSTTGDSASEPRRSIFDENIRISTRDLDARAHRLHHAETAPAARVEPDLESDGLDASLSDNEVSLDHALVELQELEHRFKLLSGNSGVLNKPTFLYHFCTSVEPAARDEFFAFCKGHGDHLYRFTGKPMPEDQISVEEFMAHVVTMVEMTCGQRAKTVAALLRAEDRMDRGLTKSMVQNILEAHFESSGLQVSKGSLMQIVEILYASLQHNAEGNAEVDAFAELFEQCTDQARKGDTLSITRSYRELQEAGNLTPRPQPRKQKTKAVQRRSTLTGARQTLQKKYPWLTKLRITWMTIYALTMILAFAIKFVSYWGTPSFEVMGIGVCFARAFGLCAMINVMILYFAVCRKLLTTARNDPFLRLWKLIPFDDNIDVHRFTGHAVMVCGLAHTIAHHAAFIKYTDGDDEAWENSPLAESDQFDGPDPTYRELLSTLPGWTGAGMLGIMLIAYPATFLRSIAFNFFWYSHHLFIFVWTILFVAHGKANILEQGTAVFWVCVPFSIFVLERIQRFFSPTNKTDILDAHTSSGCTVVHLRKPPKWDKKTSNAGTYAFLCIPSIARHEWHPFTLSSAPHDEFLRFHIRRAGDWTGKLYDLVAQIDSTSVDRDAEGRANHFKSFRLLPGSLEPEHLQRDTSGSVGLDMDAAEQEARAPSLAQYLGLSADATTPSSDGSPGRPRRTRSPSSSPQRSGSPRLPAPLAARLATFGEAPTPRDPLTAQQYPKVIVEGPISAPSDAYFRYKTSVLVAAGIGVTPMASILREVIYTWYGSEVRDGISAQDQLHKSKLQHVYFYWITRDQDALRWFADELTIISNLDSANHMQIRIHLSSVKPAGSRLLRGVFDKVHESTGWDPVSGVASKFRTEFGRPNWDDTFSSIALDHIGEDVGVFYCGPPALEAILEKQCAKHSIANENTATRFILKSENF